MLEVLKQKLQSNGNLYLAVKVFPQSGKSEIVKYQDEVLRVNLKAVPEKGKANIELIKLLAKEFGQNKESIKILNGIASRTKLIKINQ
jgi:hypothetical protein